MWIRMEDWKKWHDKYKDSSQKKHVDAIYDLVFQYHKENGIEASGDDTAEEFVAAIMKYIEESMDDESE